MDIREKYSCWSSLKTRLDNAYKMCFAFFSCRITKTGNGIDIDDRGDPMSS